MHRSGKSRARKLSGPIRSSTVRFQLGALLIALLVAASTSAFATAEGSDAGANKPKELVMNTVTQATHILGDHQLSSAARRQRLIELVAGHFDFTDMARSSLGYHWRQLTPEQQRRFVQLFTAFIEDAYLSKLEGYSGQKIKFLDTASNGPGNSEVKTLVVQPNSDQPIHLDYRLKQESGRWKVYDVTVDDISITANYRNQFNHVINSQGFDVLMKKMQSKQQELLASLGK